MNKLRKIFKSINYRIINFIIKFNKIVFKSDDDLKRLNKLLYFFGYEYNATYFDKFNLITRMNSSCIRDHQFLESIQYAEYITKQSRPQWTSYNLIWAASHSINIEGDFVECGVEKGFHALTILNYLKNNFQNKKFYLLDSWEGVDINNLHNKELHQDKEWNKVFSGHFEVVKNNFEKYQNVDLPHNL